jgi:hypothetical protein
MIQPSPKYRRRVSYVLRRPEYHDRPGRPRLVVSLPRKHSEKGSEPKEWQQREPREREAHAKGARGTTHLIEASLPSAMHGRRVTASFAKAQKRKPEKVEFHTRIARTSLVYRETV